MVLATLAFGVAATSAQTEGAPHAKIASCPHFGRPALAADRRRGALRVFAIQFLQRPATIVDAASYAHAIDCAMRTEVLPYLARGRPNLVVFDEDIGLEALASGPRGAAGRALLRAGVPSCAGKGSPCATLAVLAALNSGYSRASSYLNAAYPGLSGKLASSFIAGTDTFVRVFMTTMASEARRYGVYVVASNTQARFRLTRNPKAVAALRDPSTPSVQAVYAPTTPVAYDQAFMWGPRVVHRGAPVPLANLIADNFKLPLTGFEQVLGFAPGPSRGPAAIANLRPVSIPGTGVRLGFATSLPAFTFGPRSRGHECDDVSITYMRCLDRLGANVVIQADANNAMWTAPDGTDTAEQWQPLSWMGSAYRAVSDPTVHFAYAVNPFMVGNLADSPFDGQSAILERGLRGKGCHYAGNRTFVPGQDDGALRPYAGAKPQFLGLAPWVVPDGPRAALRLVGNSLASGSARYRYVQTAVIADLTFPVDHRRRGCLMAGR
ncbi:MAG TPA: hypothetical protein VIX82_02195 [Solirubrobacteraceae bacterium]